MHRHGVLYNQAFGWAPAFEALCAEIVARFIRNYDETKERAWIAEQDGERVGSVFLTAYSEDVAQLRLLLVEPSARGLGIGKRLVKEVTRFARQCRYKKIILWTVHILEAAHHIYRSEGYHITHEEPHSSFGEELTKQTWELELS